MPEPIKKAYWECGREYCSLHDTREEAVNCALSMLEEREKWQCPVCGSEYIYTVSASLCCDIQHLTAFLDAHKDGSKLLIDRTLTKLKKAKEWYADQQL